MLIRRLISLSGQPPATLPTHLTRWFQLIYHNLIALGVSEKLLKDVVPLANMSIVGSLPLTSSVGGTEIRKYPPKGAGKAGNNVKETDLNNTGR